MNRRRNPEHPASGLTDEKMLRLACVGMCGEFAVALHRVYGYPLAAFFEVGPDGYDEGDFTLAHAFAKHPSRKVVDSAGVRAKTAMKAETLTSGGKLEEHPTTEGDIDALSMSGLDEDVVAHAMDYVRAHPEVYGPAATAVRRNPGFLGTLGLMGGAFVGGLVVERQRGYAQKAETRARGLIASMKKAPASPFEKKPAPQAVKNDLSWSQVESPDGKGYFHTRRMNGVEYVVFERVYSDGSQHVYLEVGPRYERILAPNGKENGWKTVAAAKKAAEKLAAAQKEAEKVTGLHGPKKNPAPRRRNPDMAKLSAEIPEFQRLLDLAPAMYEAVDQSFWDDEDRDGAAKMLAEILTSEGYKVLGYGGSRVVVQIDKKYAAKVAAYDDGIRQNEDESGLWGILSREAHDLTRLVMPAYDVSGDGLVLLTEVAVPCTSKNKAKCSKMVKDARAKLGSHSLTRKLGDVDWDFNWGFHNGVFKLLDYGS